MNHLISVLLCIGVAVLAISASSEEGYCDTDEGKVAVGKEFFTENPCARHMCDGPNMISTVGCAPFLAPGCEIVEGKGKYPACCPQPVCPSDEA